MTRPISVQGAEMIRNGKFEINPLQVDSEINNEIVRYYQCFFLRNNLIKTFHKQIDFMIVVKSFHACVPRNSDLRPERN